MSLGDPQRRNWENARASRRSFFTAALAACPIAAGGGTIDLATGCAPSPSPESRDLTIVICGLRDPEGPIAMRDGSIIVVEIEGKALTRVRPNGSMERIAELEGGPNGAAAGPDGLIYVCNSGGWLYKQIRDRQGRQFQATRGQNPRPGWIESVDPKTGSVRTLYTHYAGVPLQAPNDLVFDETGHFYFTDFGKRGPNALTLGAVYRAAPDGTRLVKIIDGLFTPNGIGLSPNGKTLYVAETTTRRLWAFDLESAEKIAPAPWPSPHGGRLIASLPDYNSLDSLKVTQNGWIHVASLVNGGIWSIAPDGSESRHFPITDDPFTTNICFGGPDMRTIHVTMSGTGCLGRLRWPVPGLKLHFSEAAS